MKIVTYAIVISASLSQMAFAQSCKEEFLKTYVSDESTVYKPMRALTHTKMSNGFETQSVVISVAKDHMMTQMILPVAPWTLIYDGDIFISQNKGEAWIKTASMPKQVMDEKALAASAEAIKKIGNELCENVTLDGIEYRKISAELDVSESAASSANIAYFIEVSSQEVTRIETNVTTGDLKQHIVQTLEYDPEIKLPTPK